MNRPRAVPREVMLLSAAFFMVFAGFDGVQQYVTTYFSSIGLPGIGFVSLMIVYSTFVLAAPLGAMAIGVLGSRWAMVIGAPTYSVYILTLMTRNPVVVLLASALLGLGAGLLWTGQNAYLVTVTGGRALGRNSGVFATFRPLGSALGVVLMGAGIARAGYPVLLTIAAILPIAGTGILLVMADAGGGPPVAEAGVTDADGRRRRVGIWTAARAARSVTVWRLSMIFFSLSFISGLSLGALPRAIEETMGVAMIGVLSSVFQIFGVVGSYPTGRFSDAFGLRTAFIGASLAALGGLGALLLWRVPLMLVAGILLVAVCYAMLGTLTTVLLGELTTPASLKPVTGMVWMLRAAGYVAALALAGIVHGTAVFAISLVAFLICIVGVAPLFRPDLRAAALRVERDVVHPVAVSP